MRISILLSGYWIVFVFAVFVCAFAYVVEVALSLVVFGSFVVPSWSVNLWMCVFAVLSFFTVSSHVVPADVVFFVVLVVFAVAVVASWCCGFVIGCVASLGFCW